MFLFISRLGETGESQQIYWLDSVGDGRPFWDIPPRRTGGLISWQSGWARLAEIEAAITTATTMRRHLSGNRKWL
jgi:hypothetical protein